MNEFEDFIIDSPYELTDSDKLAICQASPDCISYKDWEKTCLADFKKRIRTYYQQKQHRRCAYCRTKVRESQASAEVEHIVPKSKKEKWMYETFNMCYSCKLCNTEKGYKKRILSNEDVTSLPQKSGDYLLIHPHIDKYSDHIEIVDNVLYKGITNKGKKTISICGLNRYDLAAERAEDVIRLNGSKVEGYLLSLVDADRNRDLVDVVFRYKERIHEICDEYKALHRY
jgi:uncharacterized protein (TIGR02646 family)